MARRPTPQMVADGVELYRKFHPQVFGIENNQYQELLSPEFTSAFLCQGLHGVHPCGVRNDANKLVRIRRLGPLLAARRIRLKSNCPSTQILYHQLQEFPIEARLETKTDSRIMTSSGRLPVSRLTNPLRREIP